MKNVTNFDNTGMADMNGRPIFVGDKVLKKWGWGPKGDFFQLHTIKKHVESNCISFLLGDIYNKWEGNEVKILEDNDIQEIQDAGIKEGQRFYIIDGKPTPCNLSKELREQGLY